MSADPRRIIVTETCCHACSVHTVHVHHENFPEMRIEDISAEQAARHLANRLEAARATAADALHRDAVRLAIDESGPSSTGREPSISGATSISIPCNHERSRHGHPARISRDAGRSPPAEGSLSEAETTALVKNNEFEAIRLVLSQGQEVCHEHRVDGAITVHCLEGRAALTVDGETRDLPAGHWLYLLGNEPHTLRGLEDSLVLLTVMFR